MTAFLQNKHILLGMTGSIAAYKSADLARRLRDAGAVVRVAMTENAKRFITPLTMQAVSGHPVHDDLFDLQAEAAMGHIELARWADLILIAPASADLLARLTHGNANDLLTSVCLATKSPIVIAPAMNQGMWHHTATQANRQALQNRGIHIFGPAQGSQACGDVGFGRMLEPQEIVEKISEIVAPGLLTGFRLLITAGPTQEAIDPVRYISNHSSGKMGYALAQAAHAAGAKVMLISGPVTLTPPAGVDVINVVTAKEMQQAVQEQIVNCDVFIGVAAVSDYCSETLSAQKQPKQNSYQLNLTSTPDIIANINISPRPYIVGFAAETENVITNARAKRQRKKMDMIIANQVGKNIGMGVDDNAVTIITDESEVSLPTARKQQIANHIIQSISKELQKRKVLA